MSELPFLESALNEAAHQRYARPWWRRAARHAPRRVVSAVAAAGVVAAAVAVVSLWPATPATDERATSPPPAPPTPYADERWGYEVTLPSGWQLSAESLTPRLTDPREILSAGTFPLVYRDGACNHTPSGALATLGPSDGFVTVQERGRDPRPDAWREYSQRPERFADRARPQRTELTGCLEPGADPIVYWIPFTDADRHFYAMVVLGREAPDTVRADAFALLDSLRFDASKQPDWKSANAP